MSMISVAEANRRLAQNATVRAGEESVDVAQGLGRVLATDIVSVIDVPPADNSAMDGYALNSADWQGPGQGMPVSQRITAGKAPVPLERGTAARIFTGAEIPAGADSVVMQENTRSDGQSVWFEKIREPGGNIRPRGQDISRGSTVLQAGHRLRPQDLGLIASLGIAVIQVRTRLRVAVISTGEELVEPGRNLGPGQIYNSNRYLLQGLLGQWGFEAVDYGITPDDAGVIANVMTRASRESDVIMTTGGVSVGEEDHVKAVVSSLGSIDLWRVAIKPGKPFAFGNVLGTPFIGLPGNPVSALVTALVIARPFLFTCQGVTDTQVLPVRQTALFDKNGSERQEYLRVRMTADGVEMFAKQSSGILFSTSWGDALVVQAAGQDIRHGDQVDVIPYSLFK
jgi:molybdopterin molybdotransferase